MATVIISPNMGLPVPVPGQDTGPDYANNISACFGAGGGGIDGHNHSSGSGVQINPNGININSDLPYNINNATLLRSVRFSVQSALLALATDIGCLYVSGVDLYYNDISGNQVRITQSGGVAGSPGSISGLASPASAAYVSGDQTFVWQSAASTPANMDFGSAIIRNISASSKGITISPPNALAADYSVFMPGALPGSQKIMSLDGSGNIAAAYDVDNSTIDISSNLIEVKAGGIGTTQLADGAVTQAKRAALGQQVSSSCGAFSTSSGSFIDVTNLTVTIVTTGRPVWVGLISDGGGSPGLEAILGAGPGSAQSNYKILRDSTEVARYALVSSSPNIPASSVNMIDVGASAASHTYKVQMAMTSGVGTGSVNYSKLIAYEL